MPFISSFVEGVIGKSIPATYVEEGAEVHSYALGNTEPEVSYHQSGKRECVPKYLRVGRQPSHPLLHPSTILTFETRSPLKAAGHFNQSPGIRT